MTPFMVLGTKLRNFLHLPGIHIKAKEKDKCISCSKYNKGCPMGIDVVNEIKKYVIDNSGVSSAALVLIAALNKFCLME